MKKAAFYSTMALVVVLGLTLAMALPVVAEMAGGKGTMWSADDGHPSGVYLLGQTIYYELDIENNFAEDDAQADWIRDRFGADAVGGWREGAVEYWWSASAAIADPTAPWVQPDPSEAFAIAANSTWEEAFDYVIQEAQLIDHPTIIGARAVVNEISAEGTYGEFTDPWSVDGTTIVRVIQPEIHISKSVTPAVAQVGQTVEYTFTITNTGDWPLENITIEDDKLDDAELQDKIPGDLVLAVHVIGEEDHYHMFTYEYTIQAGDLPLVNEATVTAIAEGFDQELFGPGASPTAMVEDTASAMVTALHPVGGTASPVSRLALLVPWIVLAGLIAGAAVFVWSRRAQGRA